MSNSEGHEAIARDVEAIQHISAVPSLLRVICQNTGMGFAAVARVTDDSWTACAVRDDIEFGLRPGGQLELNTTLCMESRAARKPVVIDCASKDPVYFNHHTPRIYNIESYISVPIIRSNGEYFGNLCAIDRRPVVVSGIHTVAMFTAFADLIATQLDSEDRQRATESALVDAQTTGELREEFIAILGHDLRNPLAAVGATAELLARRQDEPDLVRMGDRLRSTTRRMSKLIDDVLDFARGRLGSGIGIDARQVDDLANALREVVAELREANPDRTVQEDIAIGQRLVCDPSRLQQLLSNLLGNALTYGAAEQLISVGARIDGDTLELTVTNGGEPIKPGELDRVFEPYWRPSSSKPGGGLGLGLYICRQIVKAHGGEIRVSSTAESGTSFIARLPVVAPVGPGA